MSALLVVSVLRVSVTGVPTAVVMNRVALASVTGIPRFCIVVTGTSMAGISVVLTGKLV